MKYLLLLLAVAFGLSFALPASAEDDGVDPRLYSVEFWTETMEHSRPPDAGPEWDRVRDRAARLMAESYRPDRVDELNQFLSSTLSQGPLYMNKHPFLLYHGGDLDGDPDAKPLWASGHRKAAKAYGKVQYVEFLPGKRFLDASPLFRDHPERSELMAKYVDRIADAALSAGVDAVYFGYVRDLPSPTGAGKAHPTWVLAPGSWSK